MAYAGRLADTPEVERNTPVFWVKPPEGIGMLPKLLSEKPPQLTNQILMGENVDFIKGRATATLSAARTLAGQWTWQEKSIDDHQAMLTAIVGDKDAAPPIPGQEEVLSQAEAAMLAARGQWDAQLDLLHRW